MTALPSPSDSIPKPFPWLVRSRSINMLWMMRMLVKLDAFSDLWDIRSLSARESLFHRLRVPNQEARDSPQYEKIHRRLVATLVQMERHAKEFRFGRVLDINLSLLGRQFSLTVAEQNILGLAVLLHVDEDVRTVGQYGKCQINVAKQLSTIIGMPAAAMGHAVSPASRLRRSGLVITCSGGTPGNNLQLRRGGLRALALSRIKSIEELFGTFLTTSSPASLSRDDFSHLSPGFDVICQLINEAINSRRCGVNVLLYGPPGTGKTQLVRTVAKALETPLFDVSSIAEEGEPLDGSDRLAGAATGQFLLGNRRAILCFDEVDAIFNDGSDFFGKPAIAESAKAWVNNLLEQNQVPAFWVANHIESMDPAFLRRFDLVIKVDTPPLQQRVRLLERECNGLLDAGQLQRLAHVATATPAVVARAAGVVRRIRSSSQSTGQLLETVIDGTLRAQGHPSVRRSSSSLPVAGYDIAYCNTSEDLAALTSGLKQTEVGRICLYGPPGTGKTAFGHWLSSTLGKPLVLKRVSDIQSPLLGEMERNLAQAFEQASHDQAVLQIDEVDSFLQDRRKAQRSWEVSQVNEFLTQLESFDGILIASTNMMDGLDQAALRRFDYKIQMRYLRPEQCRAMYLSQLMAFGLALPNEYLLDQTKYLDRLTPGDFAVTARQHRIAPFASAAVVLEALRSEQLSKGPSTHRMGFV